MLKKDDVLRILGISPLVDSVKVYEANPVEAVDDVEKAVDEALDNPVGKPKLEESVREGMKVAICVSDKTRIFPKNEMIRGILKRISPPVRREDITFIVAGGNHAPSTPEESGIEDDLIKNYRWISHSSTGPDNVYVGKTKPRLKGFFWKYALSEIGRGLYEFPENFIKTFYYIFSGQIERLSFHLGGGPLARIGMVLKAYFPTKLYINRYVKEADLVITVGQIKPHYFAGYSGGAKSILPAVSSRGSIASNHLMRPHPGARLGRVKGNPIREDMEDCARLLPNVFILNCILDGRGRPYKFVAGDVVEAHRVGARYACEVGAVKVEKGDVVIVMAKFPVDSNIYQFSKAFAVGIRAVDEGGSVIGIGNLKEGIGPRVLVNEIIYKMGLKPLLPRGTDIFLLSSMPPREVLKTFLTPIPSLEDGLQRTWKKKMRKLKVVFFPEADPIIPYFEGENAFDWI